MKRTNVEIARMIAKKGYDFQAALDAIDPGRTPEQEEEEITEEELNEIIENVCFSFECEKDEI